MKNYSKQREKIIEVMKNAKEHLTAEDIYMTVKAEDPFLSRSTVYRNLMELTNHNIIHKISIQSGPDKYEYQDGFHHYAVCTKCGKVFNFDYDFHFEELQKAIKDRTGVEIFQKGMIIEGICEECKK